MYNNVFSEFEVKNTSIKFADDLTATACGCVGSLEETMNIKNITKKCEGVVKKNVVKPDGTGELKISLHMKYDLFLKSYGLLSEGYVAGVYSYGQGAVHEPFCLTCKVLDEDGVSKLKAYPNVVIKDGIARKIENGAEEVAEMEITLTVMPDEYGQGMYEAVEEDLTDNDVKNNWISSFSPDLVITSA